MANILGVHPDHACLNLISEAQRTGQVRIAILNGYKAQGSTAFIIGSDQGFLKNAATSTLAEYSDFGSQTLKTEGK